MNNKRLGKNINNIFSDANRSLSIEDIIDDIENISKYEIKNISLDKIQPNPYQPRKNFDSIKLKELADTIEEYGVLQPIILRFKDKKYEILSGERRYKACKMLKFDKIPAVIKEFSDDEMIQLALLENIQREDLNIMEESDSYNLILKETGWTHEELSKKIGKSRSHISNILRLNSLSDTVKKEISKKKISLGHAKLFINLNEDVIKFIIDKIINEKLNVRDTEELVKNIKNNIKVKNKKKYNKKIYHIKDKNNLEEKLSKFLSTKVNFNNNKLILYFENEEKLNNILIKIGLIDKGSKKNGY